MDANLKKPNWPLGVVGAVAGGVAGYFVFLWAGQQGFYAIVVPGAAVGLGCAALAKGESRGLGILCALLAVAAGLFSEWKISLDDDGNPASLGYFLAHLNELQPLTLILIALGAAFAYWLGKGQPRPRRPQERTDADGRPGAQ